MSTSFLGLQTLSLYLKAIFRSSFLNSLRISQHMYNYCEEAKTDLILNCLKFLLSSTISCRVSSYVAEENLGIFILTFSIAINLMFLCGLQISYIPSHQFSVNLDYEIHSFTCCSNPSVLNQSLQVSRCILFLFLLVISCYFIQCSCQVELLQFSNCGY